MAFILNNFTLLRISLEFLEVTRMYLSQLYWRHEFECCVIFMSANNNISLLFVVFDLISDHMNVIGMCFYFFPIHSSNINFRCLENSTNVYDHLNFSFLQPTTTWSGSDLMGSRPSRWQFFGRLDPGPREPQAWDTFSEWLAGLGFCFWEHTCRFCEGFLYTKDRR